MIVNITQDLESVIVSYINEKGIIRLKQFLVDDYGGFFNFAVAGPDDKIVEGLTGYKLAHEKVTKVRAKQFNRPALRYFLTQMISKEDRDIIFAYNQPNVYTCDIELDLEPKNSKAFPEPSLAEFEIDTIQITDQKLTTIILTKRPDRINDREKDSAIVRKMINEYYRGNPNFEKALNQYNQVEAKFEYILFENESELIRFFLKKVKEQLHTTIWHNSYRFDQPYIQNRCEKLGIDMGLGSPTGEYDKQRMWPKHRLAVDFMDLAQKYGWDLHKDRKSWSLDSVSKAINNIGKVKYEGTFRDMYLGDYNFFNFYGAVDVIGLMLCWLNRSYYSTPMAMSYFAKIPINDAFSSTRVSEALIFDTLIADGLINCYPKLKHEKRKFEGGYVKTPTAHDVWFPVCFDFKSLYAFIYITSNLSFENVIGKIDPLDKAATQAELAQGNYVSPLGNVYKNDKDYTMRKTEKLLYAKRKAYQAMEFQLWQKVLPMINAERKRRGLEERIK